MLIAYFLLEYTASDTDPAENKQTEARKLLEAVYFHFKFRTAKGLKTLRRSETAWIY